MSYIVLNGVKSTLIQGLLISSLPPITKPSIRTSIDTIDGRDGDIVTKLGYSAYDKTLMIGLFGDYDIDEVINYFNSEGTVIFSNEPDKFYEYQIVEQIDFEKLINFKTATVTFHVQPFKYSAVDDTVLVRSSLLHLKPFEATKNGVTVKVTNGALSLLGTASEDTQFYLPIEPMEIKNYHTTSIDYAKYTIGLSGGIYLVGESGSFDCRIITSKPTDEDSLGGTVYGVSMGNNSVLNLLDTDSKVYKYLWIKVSSGQVLTSGFTPSVTVHDRRMASDGMFFINAGNIDSRPTFIIKGGYATKEAHIYINNVKAFVLTFGGFNDEVTVDCQSMNAYSGTTLRNRDIVGDLSKVKFKQGVNRIDIYGDATVSSFKVEKESRWI